MELKSIKRLLLLLCLFCFALNDTLNPEETLSFSGDATAQKIHKVSLDSSSYTYKNYIRILYKPNDLSQPNPFIYVSTNSECKGQSLFVSTQFRDPIYIFLKKDQIQNEFYICLKSRITSKTINYAIEVTNNNRAKLPFNAQTSYYIADSSTESMEFLFERESDPEILISFWAKGKTIQKISDFKHLYSRQFEAGYLLYGNIYDDKEIYIQVQAGVGDYVNVGLIEIGKDGIVSQKLKENANEITIAINKPNQKICTKIDFPSHVTHITGKIYNKFKATSYFLNSKGEEINVESEKISTEIKDGLISEPNAIKYIDTNFTDTEGFFCILTDKESIFSLQLLYNHDYHLVNPPLFPGEIRRHFLMEGEIAVFYGMKPQSGAEEVNLNLKANNGFPEMYVDGCKSFPNCLYTVDNLPKKSPIPSNRISVYSFYIKEEEIYKDLNPISPNQPLMVVVCGGGGSKQVFGSSFCDFETTFFTDKDTINILEGNSFSQYLLEGEEDNYKITLSKEEKYNSLVIEILIFSGDVDITFIKKKGVQRKYYLSNKIVCEMYDYGTEDIIFAVKAHSRSFYTVKYIGNEEITSIDSGVNYITSKEMTEKPYEEKKIKIANLKYEYGFPYILTFYSPNCEFKATWENEPIHSEFKNYAQKIITSTDKNYAKETYDISYTIEKGEYSEYQGKYCMVYVAGLEMSEEATKYNNRSISLSEGVPHRFTYDKNHSFIYYSYHVSDHNRTLALDFNLIDKTTFDITIRINNKGTKTNKIFRNTQIYINQKDFKDNCETDEVCLVLILVKMEDDSKSKKVELTAYQLGSSTPLYLEKNVIKEDVIYGHLYKHYYFDIQKGEYGDITLDFKRGSGNIYVSVEPRVMESPMNNSDWRGLYKFPTNNEQSLKYSTYGKKITIDKKTTTDKCQDGCYVLVNIIGNMNLDKVTHQEQVPFRVSINPRIFKDEHNPKVKIRVNEFVIGGLEFATTGNQRLDYYSVILPYESEFVIFDYQADSPGLVINVGDERPVLEKYHFHITPIGRDYVYKIPKDEILEKIGLSKEASLKGLNLTMGVYTKITDSVQLSPYAFKIFMPPTVQKEYKVAAEIIHIRSDQKVQCLPTQENGKDLCIFAVVFDDMDINRNLVVYPKSQNGKSLEIYGQFVISEPIETNAVMIVRSLVEQTIKSEYLINKPYFYSENIDKSKSFLFVTVQPENSGDTIEVLTSTYSFNDGINVYPNPSSAQIFALGNHNINLNFVTTQDLLLNIVSITGEGEFYWKDFAEKRKYYLEGFNDRMSLTTYEPESDKQLQPLIAKSLVESSKQKEGFVFYITFYPRTYIDQIREGRSSAIYYRTVKMPLNFYSPISPYLSWSVNLDFYDIGLKNDAELNYDRNLFNIWATVITENDTLQVRFDPNFRPKYEESKAVKGIFDSAFGTLFLSNNDIHRIYNISTDKTDNPSLFLAVEKDNNFKEDFDYMGLELSIYSDFKTAGNNTIPEGIYLNGKLSTKTEKKLIYKLQLDKTKHYLRIEYSGISDLINFALTSDVNSEQNDYFEYLKVSDASGRKLLTVEITEQKRKNPLYFIVFAKDHNIDTKLDYFVFKYLTAEKEADFKEYLPDKQTNITVTHSSGNTYEVSFMPIEADQVTYFIKAAYVKGFVYGENINSIAISESQGAVKQITNPKYTKGVKLNYKIEGKEEIKYIKVMARVDDRSQKKFYLYRPYDIEHKEEGDVITGKKMEGVQPIDYRYNSGEVKVTLAEAYKIQKYQLILEKTGIDKENYPEYIQVEAQSSKGMYSPILTFSPTDDNAKKNRLQLSKSLFISNSMWIKKDQFKDGHFYVVVECLTEAECAYNLRFSGHSVSTFEAMTSYKYYVSKSNTQMIFRFKNSEKEADENSIVTFYATGGRNVSIHLADCFEENCNQFNFAEGSAITMKAKNYDYYVLTVDAKVGDYITVGGKMIDKKSGKSFENMLLPEYGQIGGFLRKGILEKECYLLPNGEEGNEEKDVYYITGTLFNSMAEIKFLDKDEKLIQEDIQITEQGFFSSIYNSTNSKRFFICISFLDIESFPKESFSYSIQIQGKKTFDKNVFNPQYSGYIYPRISPTGSLVFFNNLHSKEGSGYMVYNMLTTMGYPKMYVYKCKSYPACDLNYADLDDKKREDIVRIPEINRMSSYDFEIGKTGSTPIDAEQYILVVRCNKANGTDYDHCEYHTSIFGDQEEVLLIDSQPFSQYMLNNTKDYYLIDFSSEKIKPVKIQVDFLVVVGDVSFELFNAETNTALTDAHKYYLANKIFYSITVDDANNRNKGLKKIKCKIKSKVNSYYIVEYRILRDKVAEETNDMYSSINYLIPVFQNQENLGTKYIQINSVPIVMPETYIATFYSLNCKIEITKMEGGQDGEKLPLRGNFAQDVFGYNPNKNYTNFNTYNIAVKDDEKFLISDRDICMVYVSALELYKEDSAIRKEILVSEGVPQKILFEEVVKKVRYIYPHVDKEKNLTVNIHMITQGNFSVKIFFRDEEFNQDNYYSQSTIIYIERDWIQSGCRHNELCTMTVELDLLKTFDNSSYPYVETTIKQVTNEPYYLPRGIIKNEFIAGINYLYLYTDVGQKQEGYITFNFQRNSGFIFAKVVEIEQKEAEPNADWRKYKFPKEIKETGSLYYDFYNKKILFYSKDTEKCEHGCYILITIKSSVIKFFNDDREFQYFTLLADFSPATYKTKVNSAKRIEIEPEEYIIGSLYKRDDPNKEGILEYYSLTCTSDAEALEIDWQSDIAELLIKVGEGKPTFSDSDLLHYSLRRDTNIYISKKALFKDADPNNLPSLIYQDLSFGIYTKAYDTIGSAVYSFRIHFTHPELNIYRITSDQKTICNPTKIGNNQYRCLFMVIYQVHEYFNDLIIYAKSQSASARVNMYADYVANDIYNSYDVQELKKLIPNEKSMYKTTEDKSKFIFIEYGDFNKNAFISVISDSAEPIELYTSFKTFEDQLSPNPSSAQIYSLDIQMKEIKLDFKTSKSIAIKVSSLYGEGKLHEDKDAYDLRGAEDSFDLVIPGKSGNNHILTVENLRYEKTGYKNPGFAFIVEFHLRGGFNLDEITMDDTSEMIYKSADFPVYYYSKIFNRDKDINAFFYLHNYEYKDSANNNRQLTSGDLVIKGKIYEENAIYDMKEDASKKPASNSLTILGTYDSVIETGNLVIKKAEFDKFTKPTLLFVIEKGNSKVEYKTVRGEVGLSTISGDAPMVQKLYQFGKLQTFKDIYSYKLSADFNKTKYMRIQFSANSKYINFAISKKNNSMQNDTLSELKFEKKNGISYITFRKPNDSYYLYMNVFLGDDSKNTKLNNFVFKYINAFEVTGFNEYKIMNNDPKITAKKEGNNLKVSFNPIDFNTSTTKSASITYTVKVLLKKDEIGEENINMIAMSESNLVAKKHIGNINDKNQITVELNNIDANYKSIQVIATIIDGPIIEYVSYQAIDANGKAITDPEPVKINPDKPSDKPSDDKPSDKPTDGNKGGSKNDDKTTLYVIIGVSSFLVIVVIVLIVVIIFYNSKKKDLLTQVNKISFVQSDAEAKEDSNLLMDNKNELD